MSIRQGNLEVFQSFPLHPTASETASFTGATTNIADLQLFDGEVRIALDCAAGTGGTTTLALKIQHSDTTTSGDFTDVTNGAFTSLTTSASFQALFLNRNDLKRYIRLVTTQGAGSTYIYSVRGMGALKYQ
jgi:hypothetical protein